VGVGAAGAETEVVCVAKVAVVSSTRLAAGTVAPSAVKVTAPEGAPGFAVAPAAFVKVALKTVCPDTVTGVGVAVIVPELATSAATVSVIAGVGVVHTGALLPNVLQTCREAVVPASEDANAAGTGTVSVDVESVASGVTVPKLPNTTEVAPRVDVLGRIPLAGSVSVSGAARRLVAEFVCGTAIGPE
jgi:hypothetical protein